MTKFASFALLATIATLAVIPSAAFAAEANQQVQATTDAVASSATVAAVATAGKMLYGPDGRRIASIYRVTANGTAELILESKLVRVPAATISETNGKLTTSLTKKELNRR